MRHGGRPTDSRSPSALGSAGASGTALLTGPEGTDPDDPRFTSGLRLTPAFGLPLAHRRVGATADVPAFGTREHLALMSGSLDLDAIENAAQAAPLVGFAPIVLDPRGPAPDPGDDGAGTAGRVMPTRRSLRAASAGAALGRPLSADVLPGAPVPGPRGVGRASGVTLFPPLGGASTTGALRVRDVERALAARTARPAGEDPTPTGELARPFVNDACTDDWSVLADVPPPVSVDVFQRAVRAGLAPDDVESLKALDDAIEADLPNRRSRSRREVRAREKVADAPRSVAARRLAKGGVLAITALGVVSGATPQGLHAFGITKDASTARNTIDFASALAPETSAPVLTTVQVEQLRQSALAGHLRTELDGATAADAFHATSQAGGAMADLARQRDTEVLASRAADRARAIRDVAANPQHYAALLLADRGLGAGEMRCLVSLWNRESQWNYRAVNVGSGAYGIAQALPGSKMNSVGADWRTNPITQIKWGLNYISERYGTPCGAWAHSQATGWY